MKVRVFQCQKCLTFIEVQPYSGETYRCTFCSEVVFSPEIHKTWVDEELSEVNPFLFLPEDKKIEETRLRTIEEL